MFKKSIPGMIDCEGKPVHEGDIVEFLDWCYASHRDHEGKTYLPLYGVVRWNTEYFTYEPLIFSEDDFNGNCFANVCKYRPPDIDHGPNKVDYPATYFKVIGTAKDIPHLLNIRLTQKVGWPETEAQPNPTPVVASGLQLIVASGSAPIFIKGKILEK